MYTSVVFPVAAFVLAVAMWVDAATDDWSFGAAAVFIAMFFGVPALIGSVVLHGLAIAAWRAVNRPVFSWVVTSVATVAAGWMLFGVVDLIANPS